MNYCVPLAVAQVTLIIRRGDGQWAKCDKLIVSVADYFNEAIFTAPRVSKECRFQKGFRGKGEYRKKADRLTGMLPNDASNNPHF